MNKAIRRQTKGSIRQRSKDSLTLILYANENGKAKQLWETVKRLPNETDAQLRGRAEKRLAELVKKQDEGANIIAERLTLAKYLGDWLDAYEADHKGSVTPQSYRYLLNRHVIARIGHLLLPKVTASHVEGIYRAMRDDGLSGETRRHVHRVLSSALKRAVRDGNLTRNVCDSVDASLHKPEPPKLYKLTPADVRKLIDAAAETEIAALVPVLAYTGLRLGEALGLRWSDVDLDGDNLSVQQVRKRIGRGEYGKPKTEKSARDVPLAAPVATALYEHRQSQRKHRESVNLPDPEHNLVFTRPDGLPMDHDNVSHRWQRIRKAAGVPQARIHDLRHFAATLMADSGAPAHHVSAVLGHSNVTTTVNRYYRSNESDKRSAIDILERALK